jgi:hypothetical protein
MIGIEAIVHAWTVTEVVIVNAVVVAAVDFVEATLDGTQIVIHLVGTRAPLHDGGSPLPIADETETAIFPLIGAVMIALDLVAAAHHHL